MFKILRIKQSFYQIFLRSLITICWANYSLRRVSLEKSREKKFWHGWNYTTALQIDFAITVVVPETTCIKRSGSKGGIIFRVDLLTVSWLRASNKSDWLIGGQRKWRRWRTMEETTEDEQRRVGAIQLQRRIGHPCWNMVENLQVIYQHGIFTLFRKQFNQVLNTQFAAGFHLVLRGHYSRKRNV